MLEAGAQSCYVDYEPSFGRGPFGHYICTSVNDAVLHGLPHDYAYGVEQDASKDIWLTTRGGIARIRGDADVSVRRPGASAPPAHS